MFKRLIGLTAVAAFALGGAAVAQDNTLVYVVNNESDTYDPGTTTETFATPIIVNTFEGLVRRDENGAVEPGLAESWEISEDGLTYTFHIREDAKWSDGEPLDANDFVWAWKRVLTPASGAKNAAQLFLIKGGEEFYNNGGEGDVAISAPDDRTLTFTLNQRVPYMMQLLPFSVFHPTREDVVTADPDGWTRDPETYIGTGAFRVAEFNLGESVVLEKNPNYWQADSVELDKIVLRLIPEPSTALAAMEAGDVDGIESVPASDIPRLSVESDAFMVVPALGTTYAFFNPNQAPLDDVKVRQALSMAIDREQIVEFVLQAADTPAISLVPYGMSVAGEDFRDAGADFGLSTTADVEGAQALLAEAGYANGEGFPETIFVTYTSPPIQKLLEAIQQMWKENLNIDVKIEATEWQVYYPEVQKIEYQIAQMGWGADYPHPMTFLDNFTSNSPNNLAGWKNEDYDAAIAAAKATAEPAESLAEMRKAEAIMMNDHVILPMYHRNQYMMMSPAVKGFWRSSLNEPIFRKTSIER